MPMAEFRGEQFDSILLCVDRASNWITAKPTKGEGLTGSKAAHMLLDGWGEVAIPSVITSDQGAPFVSQFSKRCVLALE